MPAVRQLHPDMKAIGVTEFGGPEALHVVELADPVAGPGELLGKADGLQVVADAAPADRELVAGLGADLVVSRGDGFGDRVRAIVPDGADGMVDAALLNQLGTGAVRDGGRIATLRGFQGEPGRGISFHPVSVRSYAPEQAKLDRLRQQAEAGQLTLRVAGTFPAEQAADSHRRLEAGGTRGRLVLEF
ncbi:MAG: zinc-binding dehydrogenase [Nocardiopsaceae bacterium]|nr:zinc-binding dehydrogenase [Nocardiopsaceae bacterium]